ncbi:MAG: hypothetical protein K0R63_893 [Rickettsiales bacterium]|jgi:hypothetical protein|nr:hypothetical protein [Rickettsiales bacterium]
MSFSVSRTYYSKRIAAPYAVRGFSLIELSIIIGIAATLAVGSMRWISPPVTTHAKRAIETQKKMLKITDAVTGFIATYGRLPCPADPLMRIDNTRSASSVTYEFGEEALTSRDCTLAEGAVPVRSLNLGPEARLDGWGNEFRYRVSTNLCGTDGVANNEIGCTTRDFREGVAGSGATPDGNITVSNGSTNLTTKGAFVLMSAGPNAKDIYAESGVLLSGTGTTHEEENSDADTTFIQKAYDGTFDDIVVYRNKSDLKALATLKSKRLVTEGECSNNSTELAKLTATIGTSMTTNIDDYRINNGGVYYNEGEEAIIGLLWTMQEICGHSNYYGAAANGAWQGKKCPGGGTYDTTQSICICADGSWDGAC